MCRRACMLTVKAARNRILTLTLTLTVNSNRNPTTNPNVTLTLSNVQRDHVDTHHEAISNQYERPRCRLASARLTVQAHIVTFVNKLTGLKGVMDRCKK